MSKTENQGPKSSETSTPASTEYSDPKNPHAPVDAEEEHAIADANDITLAVRHHSRGLARAKTWLSAVAHYFFVGSVSLATIAIAFAIPLAMLAALTSLLLIPGYVVYTLARTEAETPVGLLQENKYLLASLVIITVFWAGYFFQHGWPRMQGALQRIYLKAAPMITWALKSLSQFGDNESKGQ